MLLVAREGVCKHYVGSFLTCKQIFSCNYHPSLSPSLARLIKIYKHVASTVTLQWGLLLLECVVRTTHLMTRPSCPPSMSRLIPMKSWMLSCRILLSDVTSWRKWWTSVASLASLAITCTLPCQYPLQRRREERRTLMMVSSLWPCIRVA